MSVRYSDTRPVLVVLLWLLMGLLPAPAHAQGGEGAFPNCAEQPGRSSPPIGSGLSLVIENDLIANTDQHYTSGFKLSQSSPNLDDFADDPCLPAWVRSINRTLRFVDRGSYSGRNMIIALGQSIFTPRDSTATDVVKGDRPYAGWLYLGLGYNSRDAESMRSYEINIGFIGPASLARQSQSFVHDLRGFERFAGWNNQLRNELGLQIVYEEKRRYALWMGPVRPRADFIGHYGASLGNVATYANLGAEMRAGVALPDDFGTSSIRPGGDNNAPLAAGDPRRGFGAAGVHGFVSFDVRAVARNIFLDGNTFTDSHRVDKRYLVGDIAVGLAWRGRYGKIAYSYYVRSKEFYGQPQPQRFGSVTLSAEF